MNFVTGEKLQEFAEVTVALNTENNFNSDLVKTQIKNTQTKCYVFSPDKTNVLIPDQLKYAKIIFTYPHILDYFFKFVFPQIQGPFTLITHNSDAGVDSNYHTFLNSFKIKKWFCQNKYTSHPKLFSLPIGIANSQWPHGNLQTLQNIIDKKLEKNNLVFKNFDCSTNTRVRLQANIETEQNGFKMSAPLPFADYIQNIKQSYFSIAPPGNGVDCHRIWECLYLQCVPVVLKHPYVFTEFSDLPIMYVDSYATVNENFLKEKIKDFYPFHKFNLEKLNLNYWKEKICYE